HEGDGLDSVRRNLECVPRLAISHPPRLKLQQGKYSLVIVLRPVIDFAEGLAEEVDATLPFERGSIDLALVKRNCTEDQELGNRPDNEASGARGIGNCKAEAGLDDSEPGQRLAAK